MKTFFYYLAQTLFTGYCLYNGLFWDGLFYMFLIGLGNITICFFIASRKRPALIISLVFYILIFFAYASMFFMMIITSIKDQYIDPFFLMAAEIHTPVLLYSIMAVVFLGKYLINQGNWDKQNRCQNSRTP